MTATFRASEGDAGCAKCHSVQGKARRSGKFAITVGPRQSERGWLDELRRAGTHFQHSVHNNPFDSLGFVDKMMTMDRSSTRTMRRLCCRIWSSSTASESSIEHSQLLVESRSSTSTQFLESSYDPG